MVKPGESRDLWGCLPAGPLIILPQTENSAKTSLMLSDLGKKERIKIFGRIYPIQALEHFQQLHLKDPSNDLKTSGMRRKKFKMPLQPSFCQLADILKAPQLFELDPYDEDSSLLDEVVDRWKEEFQGPSEISVQNFVELIQRGVFRVLVLTQADLPQGSHVAGFAVISSYGQRAVFHLDYLVVSPLARGKGLGSSMCRLLISFLKDEARKNFKGPKFLSLECDASLIPFYTRFGWIDTKLEPRVYHIEKKGVTRSVEYFYMMIQLTEKDSRIFNREFLSFCRAFFMNQLDLALLALSSPLSPSAALSLPSSDAEAEPSLPRPNEMSLIPIRASS